MNHTFQRSLPNIDANSSEPSPIENFRVVSVRLRWAEYESFAEQARGVGLSNSMALRIAARRVAGFLEVDRELREQMQEMLGMIGSVSHNVARLNAAYSQSAGVDLDALASQRFAFGEAFVKLDELLRFILNTSRRRTDGRFLLLSTLEQ